MCLWNANRLLRRSIGHLVYNITIALLIISRYRFFALMGALVFRAVTYRVPVRSQQFARYREKRRSVRSLETATSLDIRDHQQTGEQAR